MERYRMNRPDCRTNGMTSMMPHQMPHQMAGRTALSRPMPPCQPPCDTPAPSCGCKDHKEDVFEHCDKTPSLAMGYVPMQEFNTTFEMCKALQVGTIFPELCKPFVGKRGKTC